MRCVNTILAAVFALCAYPAVAQDVHITEVRIYIFQELKQLPEGYHHFRAVPAHVARKVLKSDTIPLCNSEEAAIAFGKYLAIFNDEVRALDEVRTRRDAPDCGYIQGEQLTPEADSVRGADAKLRIHLLRFRDSRGEPHYYAEPAKKTKPG